MSAFSRSAPPDLPPLQPLVEPHPELTQEEMVRYSRHLLIPEFGLEAQRRLKNARVLVIGAGGLGSPVLQYLAAAGVGTIGIVDDDTVEISNLQRQVIHGVSDLGDPKAVSAQRSIRELNPLVEVVLHTERLDSSNALGILAGYDLAVDGTDNFATRYLVNDAAALLGKPYVWGSILRFDGQVSVFWEKHGPGYRDLYPEAPPPGSVPSCAEGGVLGVLCASIGSLMGTEAVKLITGVGRTLLGRVLIFNALDMSWQEITVRRDPTAEPVTRLGDYEAFCGLGPSFEAEEVPSIKVRRLAELLSSRERGEAEFELIDVREPSEHAIVSIDGARLIPKDRVLAGGYSPDPSLDVYVHCKSGKRSAEVVRHLRDQGHRHVFNVDGGILEWVSAIEPGQPVY